jgi:predicted adenine nucleotide alpha hydrolase (AANH) superfamily ATPase
MNILLHVCCGPCSLYPLRKLHEKGYNVRGYFYNPNIHPYREFKRRLDTMAQVAENQQISLLVDDNYGLTPYLQRVVFNENNRCSVCYDMRLEVVAKRAAAEGMDAMTTTLLYSKYQNHELIREKGENLARAYGISFYYEDFRLGWQEGIDRSKEMGLYRQPYCGCIYSEQERYDPKKRKK